ncbi:hypothetical protein [Saccharospirillum impatiens]|uniref:hypothetical protein n=1 Tax=Saccharospirillum impatiens TaxID=169438 RepID=UPI0004170384|nr:hypothetical protein [Saccharospirillum impatiens]
MQRQFVPRRDFHCSPDGARLAYRADLESSGVVELHSASADGSSSLKVSGALIPEGDVVDYSW